MPATIQPSERKVEQKNGASSEAGSIRTRATSIPSQLDQSLTFDGLDYKKSKNTQLLKYIQDITMPDGRDISQLR